MLVFYLTCRLRWAVFIAEVLPFLTQKRKKKTHKKLSAITSSKKKEFHSVDCLTANLPDPKKSRAEYFIVLSSDIGTLDPKSTSCILVSVGQIFL